MPKTLRKPLESTMSKPRWELVDDLWQYYHDAGRPPLAKVSRMTITQNEQAERQGGDARKGSGGTASTETIRRTLNGVVVPTSWLTARALLRALCHFADIEPNQPRENHFGDDLPSPEQQFRALWNAALDDPSNGKPKPKPKPRPAKDPWAPGGNWGSQYPDEPPF